MTKPEAQGYYVFVLQNRFEIQEISKDMRALVFVVGLLFLLNGPVSGAGKYLKVDYPASTAPNQLQIAVTYTMWIPDDVARFRCVIVHQHGAGRNAAEHGATAAYDLHWQALAKKWDCALLGPSYHVLTDATDATPGGSELWFDPRRGSDKAFLKALGEFVGAGEPSGACYRALGPVGTLGRRHLVRRDDHPIPGPRGCRVPAIRLVPEPAQISRSPKTPAAAYAVPVMGNAGVKEQERGA